MPSPVTNAALEALFEVVVAVMAVEAGLFYHCGAGHDVVLRRDVMPSMSNSTRHAPLQSGILRMAMCTRWVIYRNVAVEVIQGADVPLAAPQLLEPSIALYDEAFCDVVNRGHVAPAMAYASLQAILEICVFGEGAWLGNASVDVVWHEVVCLSRAANEGQRPLRCIWVHWLSSWARRGLRP